MKRFLILLALVVALTTVLPAFASEGMNHGEMKHGDMEMGGTFKYSTMVDGLHAEFQVMPLADMNMTDPDGKTHHVMAMFKKDGAKIENAMGKVKLIAPSGRDQVAPLVAYAKGDYAANFTIDEPGKWGVICLLKDDAGTHTVKFWYHHM